MRGRATVVVSLAALLVAAPAPARTTFRACSGKPGVQCATVRHDGFALHVERVPARRGNPDAKALIALLGGPGQTNTLETTAFTRRFAPLLAHRELIVFDQRGTGASGALHCTGGAAGCARQLGARAHVYTSRASAQDMDAVRAAAGARHVTVFGVSYGTWVAQAYARLYPARVDGLLFDSVYGARDSADPFFARSYPQLRTAARLLCAHGACRRLPGLSSGLYATFIRLYRRLAAQPASGTWFDARGAPHAVGLNPALILQLLFALDQNASLQGELPRALAAADRGEPALLARLLGDGDAGPTAAETQENEVLNLVTHCEESRYPWARTVTDPQRRTAAARRALAAIPASLFAPGSPDLAYASSQVPECTAWPQAPRDPTVTGRMPRVPTLIFHGELDVRTPLGSASALAREIPGARVLTVPHTGHSATATDRGGCARRAIAAFAAGRLTTACPPNRDGYAPRPLPPAPNGPVLGLAEATVQDALWSLDAAASRHPQFESRSRGGGLLGGAFAGTTRGIALRGYTYVAGLSVSGLVPETGTATLTVSGTHTGTLAFRADGTVTGSLDGHGLTGGRGTLARRTPTDVYVSAGNPVPAG